MTTVIALANGKGGVKKSSMSRAIATEYTKAATVLNQAISPVIS